MGNRIFAMGRIGLVLPPAAAEYFFLATPHF
jgi:hypothetical protein